VVRDKTFGKATEEPIEASSFLDSMIVTMMDAGGKLPKGTSFTNHAFLDLAGESAKVEGTVGYLVNSVGAKGPAQSAGISSGDLITKIAGKRVTDFWSLTSALERASKKSSFEVEFVSRGQARMITVVTSFRSEVAEDPSLNREAAPKVADVTPITASSVADELLKLAKLKDQGLLSEREFENEKRKLLSK
jgi:membrane-associated protease RseP (regulator of RpoE activity)